MNPAISEIIFNILKHRFENLPEGKLLELTTVMQRQPLPVGKAKTSYYFQGLNNSRHWVPSALFSAEE